MAHRAALHDFNTKERNQAVHDWLRAEINFARAVGRNFAEEVIPLPYTTEQRELTYQLAQRLGDERRNRYGLLYEESLKEKKNAR